MEIPYALDAVLAEPAGARGVVVLTLALAFTASPFAGAPAWAVDPVKPRLVV